MDTRTSCTLPTHEHPLFFSSRLFGKCRICNLSINIGNIFVEEGYTCKQCDVCFHKECTEAPLEIEHPSHPQHPLHLQKLFGKFCSLCGKTLPRYTFPRYSCLYVCDFHVDITCGLKPSPLAIEKPLCHDHPLVFLKIRGDNNDENSSLCEVCKERINGPSYTCVQCDVYFHVDCIHFSKELNHPHHSNHPLKQVAYDTLGEDLEKMDVNIVPEATPPQLSLITCSVCCGTIEKKTKVIYYCSICNFIACFSCTKSPPRLVIEHFKTHKHPLDIFSRRITFTCDVCGREENKGRPYFCTRCDFVIHGECINLPRVININRHVHRVYFTHHLGAGYSKCGICRENLCQYRGAYSCSICPKYAVHSRCATARYVWDGVELEGNIPNDGGTEDISPFKAVGDSLIKHFSHEKHPLKLYKDNNHIFNDDKWIIRCEACIHPLGFDSFYACEECSFALHEKCANLPLKKRLIFSTAPYTLKVNREFHVVDCNRCGMLYDGFKYTSAGREDVDVHCGSLSEPFFHNCHKHPLYFEVKQSKYRCGACKKDDAKDYALRCDGCEFDLCFYCANLPLKTWHMSHEHPLTLCYDTLMGFRIIWCDRCERELDPSKWFYACFDCGVTLHVRCVIEDFSCLKQECFFIIRNWLTSIYKLVRNNHSTRPSCNTCQSLCTKVNIIYDCTRKRYICSRSCM